MQTKIKFLKLVLKCKCKFLYLNNPTYKVYNNLKFMLRLVANK